MVRNFPRAEFSPAKKSSFNFPPPPCMCYSLLLLGYYVDSAVSARGLRSIFRDSATHAPSVVILDQIESIAMNPLLCGYLLTEIDDGQDKTARFVLCATCRVWECCVKCTSR